MSKSDIPKTFTADYYDADYFKTPKGKKFLRPNGTVDAWSYSNPDGESEGCRFIAEAWKTMFNPKNSLDAGAGRGTMVAYLRDVGVEAYGFDYSKWAVNDKGRYPRCKQEWLRLHDCTKPWSYKDGEFDLVSALDLMEHLYLPDVDFVVDELYRVTGKWAFLEIAVVGGGDGFGHRYDNGYILKKGEPVPIEREGNAVAGHVLVQPEFWWEEKLDRDGWQLRRDMVNWFVSLTPEPVIRNWLQNSILVYSKED